MSNQAPENVDRFNSRAWYFPQLLRSMFLSSGSITIQRTLYFLQCFLWSTLERAIYGLMVLYTLSGRIGKVGASHAAVARSISAEVALIYTMHEAGGTAHEGGGCDQLIWSTVSDTIIRSWLWLTATGSSPLGYFGKLLQVVDN